MTFSWSSVSVLGGYIARYCRQYPWWITWHIRFQTLGAMGTLSFVAVASSMVHEQLGGVHQLLGIGLDFNVASSWHIGGSTLCFLSQWVLKCAVWVPLCAYGH